MTLWEVQEIIGRAIPWWGPLALLGVAVFIYWLLRIYDYIDRDFP